MAFFTRISQPFTKFLSDDAEESCEAEADYRVFVDVHYSSGKANRCVVCRFNFAICKLALRDINVYVTFYKHFYTLIEVAV